MRCLVSLVTPAHPKCRLRFDREENPAVTDPIPEAALEALEWVVNERLDMVRTEALEHLTAQRNKLLEELRKEVGKQ